MISEQAVSDYQRIYKKVYGKDIPYDEALRQGTILLRLMKIIYKPIPKSVKINEGNQ